MISATLKTFLRKLSALALGVMAITGIGASATVGSQSEEAATSGQSIACTYHNDRSAKVPCSSCGVRG